MKFHIVIDRHWISKGLSICSKFSCKEVAAGLELLVMRHLPGPGSCPQAPHAVPGWVSLLHVPTKWSGIRGFMRSRLDLGRIASQDGCSLGTKGRTSD